MSSSINLSDIFTKSFSKKDIEESVNTFFFNVINAIENFESEKLWFDIKDYYYSFNTLASVLNINKDDNNYKIYIFGFFKALFEITKNISDYSIQLEEYKKLLNSYSYLESIINYLSVNKSATHKELCDHLGLKTSTLSNFVKKIEPYDFFRTKRTGRYKLYFITRKGKELDGVIYKEVDKKNINLSITTDLLDLIRDEIEKDNINVDEILLKWNVFSYLTKYQRTIVKEKVNLILTSSSKKKSRQYVGQLHYIDVISEYEDAISTVAHEVYWNDLKVRPTLNESITQYLMLQGDKDRNEYGFFRRIETFK